TQCKSGNNHVHPRKTLSPKRADDARVKSAPQTNAAQTSILQLTPDWPAVGARVSFLRKHRARDDHVMIAMQRITPTCQKARPGALLASSRRHVTALRVPSVLLGCRRIMGRLHRKPRRAWQGHAPRRGEHADADV